MKSLIRLRMSSHDAHYGGNLVDGARMLQLFGDVATELLIQLDGDEGLFKAYDSVEFMAPVFAGDYIEAVGEIVNVGNSSRKMVFEARKVIVPRPDISESAADVLAEPIVVCRASGTCVTPKDKQRKKYIITEEGKMEKLIITAAICGAEVMKENNPAVPYTVEEIAREAESAYKAGASIIHLHVREDDGTPTQDKERFKKCIDAIREKCPDVIIQPSTGGAVGMTDLERLQPTELHPEMATLDCGTCNFGGDEVFVNTENTIKNFGKILIERGVKPEIEVFDKGMIDYAIRFQKQGYIQKPMHFDFVLGVQMLASARDLVFMAESIPEGSTWTVSGVGKSEFQMAALAIVMGGHVRVGLEDNVYIEKGVLAKSNGELVEKVVRLAKELGREIATPDEAREILGLKK